MLRPYGFFNHEDPVDVIRHEDEGIHFYCGEIAGDLEPSGLDEDPNGTEPNGVIDDVAEHALAPVCADSDEVRAGEAQS